MVDPVGLTALLAVRDLGTVAAAAVSLGYTTSAVSQQLRRLERQTGARVLERVGRGVVLTEHGMLLATEAAPLVRGLDALARLSTTGPEAVVGTVRVSAFTTAIRGLLVDVVGVLRKRAPRLQVSITEADPWQTVDLVERGSVELGVVHDWVDMALALPTGLDRADVCVDEADVLLPADHPLARRTTLTLTDLADAAWVTVPAGTICHTWLSQSLRGRTGRDPHVVYADSDFATHVAFVAAGLAVALVPRLARAPLPAGVRAVPLTDSPARRTVSAVWRRGEAHTRIRTLLVDTMREVAGR